MKAVVYNGPRDVAVTDVDDARIEFRGQKMGTGQCPVKRYNRHLRNLIHAGKAQPSFIVSHHLPLDEAPEGYKHLDSRDEGWTKVLLHPNGTS
jgi:glutathione-independent formaldehyde dehydrogenase